MPAPEIFAPHAVTDAGDVAEVELREAVVAGKLGLDLALRIVQHELVALAAVEFLALQAGKVLLSGQMPGRHVGGVVDAAGDDGTVRVAFHELHQHFLADARQLDRAEAFPRKAGRDPDPAGGPLVVRAAPVPVEAHLDPAIRIAVDLLAAQARDDGRLDALDADLAVPLLRHEAGLRRDGPEPGGVFQAAFFRSLVAEHGGLPPLMAHLGDPPGAVDVLAVMAVKLEDVARRVA